MISIILIERWTYYAIDYSVVGLNYLLHYIFFATKIKFCKLND